MAIYFPCEYEQAVNLRKFLDNKRCNATLKVISDHFNCTATYFIVLRDDKVRDAYINYNNYEKWKSKGGMDYQKETFIIGNRTFKGDQTIKFSGLVSTYFDTNIDLRFEIDDYIYKTIENEGHLSEEGQKAYNEILDEIFEDTDINIFDNIDKEE